MVQAGREIRQMLGQMQRIQEEVAKDLRVIRRLLLANDEFPLLQTPAPDPWKHPPWTGDPLPTTYPNTCCEGGSQDGKDNLS